jgi:hypothetical protein
VAMGEEEHSSLDMHPSRRYQNGANHTLSKASGGRSECQAVPTLSGKEMLRLFARVEKDQSFILNQSVRNSALIEDLTQYISAIVRYSSQNTNIQRLRTDQHPSRTHITGSIASSHVPQARQIRITLPQIPPATSNSLPANRSNGLPCSKISQFCRSSFQFPCPSILTAATPSR